MTKNCYKVPQNQWNKWTRNQQGVYNRVFNRIKNCWCGIQRPQDVDKKTWMKLARSCAKMSANELDDLLQDDWEGTK